MFQLSNNAIKRAQQRGISQDTIHLISQLADRRVRVPGGATALSVSARARRRSIICGLAPTQVDRANGVVLIADLVSRTVITVEHGRIRPRRAG